MKLNANYDIHDRTIDANRKLNIFEKFFMLFINDTRDTPIAWLILKITAFMLPVLFYIVMPLFYPFINSTTSVGWFNTTIDFLGNHPFNYYVAGAYLAMMVFFFAPYVLMLHNISHRKFYRKPFRWMNYYPTWLMGMMFGQSPESYYSHHIWMHHTENNLLPDRSSTLPFRRDSRWDFTKYITRFLFFGLPDCAIFMFGKKRYKVVTKLIIGETVYFTLAGFALYNNLYIGLTIFVIPLLIARFGMMAGNWGQHAFVDINDPNNCHLNSITCINSSYNQRGFNDGYHISHHLKGSRHWSDHPAELVNNRKEYIKQKAIVFKDMDFFLVWLNLMMKRHKYLATKFVQLDDKNPLSEQEVLDLFEERLQPYKE